MLEKSVLGLARDDANFADKITLAGIDKPTVVTDSYTSHNAKKSQISYRANRYVVHCRNATAQRMDIIFHDTLALKTDVLSLLIGINDTYDAEATTPEQFEALFRQLLTDCKQQHPTILFVLGLPFVFPVGKGKENWELWRDDVHKRQAVTRKLAIEFNAVLVDYPAVLAKAILRRNVEYWIWDGIHSTVFAHELMAREWIKQVSSRLEFLKKYDY